jgi:hypothetical protein
MPGQLRNLEPSIGALFPLIAASVLESNHAVKSPEALPHSALYSWGLLFILGQHFQTFFRY